ncbi:cache domain-containing protein [Vibrio maerlii]|uniref:sensor domain-containing diguanylate cyclase n=1 Tax=Vibrio maerlii TaxID=2231648 RepID=UPI000E3CAD1C|nr:cache domain-containing protein [Vibrio maerlii]
MNNDTEHRILQLLRTLPFLLVLLFISLFYFINVSDQSSRLESYQSKLIEETLETRKSELAQQVTTTVNQIDYERKQTESVLKNEIKQRVDEAHNIAKALYEQNSLVQVTDSKQMIAEALRPIRFNENRGYFFIFDMEGNNVMHPLLPHIQGENRLSAKDAHGVEILKEHIELIKQSDDGSAFYRWWFAKPGEIGEFEKIGYGRYFEPFNWFIGTGEYIVEVEQAIQKQLIHWVSTIHHDHDDNLFILDRAGKVIAHSQPEFIGKAFPMLANKALLQIEQNGQNSAFIQHTSHIHEIVGENTELQDKLSFVTFDEPWQWIIGSGIKLSGLEAETDLLVEQLHKQHNSEIINITLILLPLAALLSLFSFALSQYLSKRFKSYQLQISQHFTQLQSQKEQLRYQAEHDGLTELPNRTRFEKVAKQHLLHAHAQSGNVAVFFVDVVHFKRINDQYGHQVGDEVIKQVAKRFQSVCPVNAIVARFGGDEFVWSIPFQREGESSIEPYVQMINGCLNEPMVINDTSFEIKVTTGVAVYPNDNLTMKDLMAHADMALTYAKQKRKGQYALYNQSINDELFQQLEQEN